VDGKEIAKSVAVIDGSWLGASESHLTAGFS